MISFFLFSFLISFVSSTDYELNFVLNQTDSSSQINIKKYLFLPTICLIAFLVFGFKTQKEIIDLYRSDPMNDDEELSDPQECIEIGDQ